jgi:cytochrome b subunit of formate dehydrogenase
MNDPNEIIDRYVYAVTKRLPVKQREDIDKEIRSLIDDMLTDGYPDRKDDPESVKAVLNELGNPYDLAAKYQDNKRYLIGPEHYPMYIFILKIVLAAVTGGLIIALTVKNIVNTPVNPITVAVEMVTSIMSALLGVFAWVTIVFALIGYFREEQIDAAIAEVRKEIKWTLEDLPEIPSQKAIISKSEPIASMIFGLIGFIIFNYAAQALSIISIDKTGTKSVPILNIDRIDSFILIINIIVFIGFIREIARLIEGRHTLRLSIGTAVISGVSLVLSLYLITNPLFFNPNFVAELKSVFGKDTFAGFDILLGLRNLLKFIIGISIFAFVVETISNFYKSLALPREKSK